MARWSRWFESFARPGLWTRGLSPFATMDVPTRPDTSGTEQGATGTPILMGYITGEDYNPELDGDKAMRVYDQMRRSDGQVAATLQALKVPLKSADWRIDPPTGGDADDQAIADFCTAALFEQGAMRDTWSFVLDHLLLRLDFGNSVLEKVWTLDDANTLRYRRLAPRLPHTITQWVMDPEGSELQTIVQQTYKNGQFREMKIGAANAVVTVHQREGDNWFGRSVLRSAHKHWFYVNEFYRIDAIKHDRFGVGIPRAKVSGPQTDDQLAKIDTMLMNLRSHERAFIRSTENVEVDVFIPPGGQGGANGMKDSIDHHNAMIPRSILASFLAQGEQAHGSFGLGSKLADFFTNAEQALADDLAHDLTMQVVRPLCLYNFTMAGRAFPRVVASDVSDVDRKEIADCLQKVSSFITPDDDIEDALRKTMGFPAMASTIRGRTRPTLPSPAPGVPPSPGGPVPGAPLRRRHLSTLTRLRQGHVDPVSGLMLGREPTARELQVFAFRDIVGRLDAETAALAQAIADVRRRQLAAVVADIVKKDARDTGAFTDIRPGEIGLPFVGDLERAIKVAQNALVQYGEEEVRRELARQGVMNLRRTSLEVTALAAADASARVAKSALVASAKITAERVSDAWYGRILETALQERRTGKQGDDLAAAVQGRLFDEAEKGVLGDARAEVNEAFAVGRATEAQRHADAIESCEYSALMDQNTCDVCAATDGEMVTLGSDRYYAISPPNVNCEGNRGRPDACRCAWIFIGKDAPV